MRVSTALHMFAISTLFACALEHEQPEDADPMLPPPVIVATPTIDDVRCAGIPDAGPTASWHHTTSRYIAELGEPRHRGTDLIASSDDATQTLGGKVTYGALEKDLEDETVELFACIDARWQPLGDARTDEDGRFSLSLSGDERLPIGMRDLYVSVSGDRTGAAFIGFVAPAGSPIVVSDVDGTLTASEDAYPTALVLGGDVAVQLDAPATLMSAAVHGVSVVYVTTRGDRFAQDTRTWFAQKGFPRGPLRLPTALVTLPGDDTIDFKSSALASLATFDIVAGFGNRATDVAAYTNGGLTPDRILIKLPEFTDELSTALSEAKATGFELYDAVRTHELAALMPEL